MKFPKLEDINSERFLNEAFEAEHHEKWLRGAKLRRNVYLWLFLTGIACIFITAFTDQRVLSILSLFLSTISLIVMTKYDTQVHFLKTLRLRETDQTKATDKA